MIEAADIGNEPVAHPHLRGLLDDVRDVNAGVEALRACSAGQLAWKPEPGTWNVLECIDHLTVMNRLYFPRIRTALDEAPRGNSDAPFRPSFLGRRFIQAVGPEVRKKVRTFRIFEPAPALSDPGVLDRFLDQQSELAALIRRADSVDLNRPKLTSPVNRLLRFSLGEALTFLVGHEQRHLAQARRLTRHTGFPPA